MKVVCVLKSGGSYNADHVVRLRMQLPIDQEFICLTDLDFRHPGIIVQPLVHNFPGWWSKIELFRNLRDCVYIDLDSDIVGNVAKLRSNRFTMCKDFIRPSLYNSSVMAWSNPPTNIYDTFIRAPRKYIERYRRHPKIGDQGFIQDHSTPETFAPGDVRSYRLECMEEMPCDATVITYHGRPKPWEI